MKRIKEFLAEKKLDAILVSDGYNMHYLSGFSGATGYLYISNNRNLIITDGRYTTQAKLESKGFEVVEMSNQVGYASLIREYMAMDKVAYIGFEDLHFIYFDFMNISKACKAKEWVPLGKDLSNLRIIKTKDELDKLAKAEAIGDAAFSYILTVIKPGMTELEVAVELESYMKTHGASNLSFDSIVASGINSSMPHATPSNKKIEMGDFLTMDFGCLYEGYCSDMTRTIVIGKANEKQKEIYNIVLNAQLAALDAICAGKTGKEIDGVARKVITDAGYGDYFGHGLGHSVGLEIHEEPRLSPNNLNPLIENIIETVEPGIYIPDFGGVRIEDMVVVTKDGHINLTHSTKELIEL
jgi:Xaa-Pro aminopeptidase